MNDASTLHAFAMIDAAETPYTTIAAPLGRGPIMAVVYEFPATDAPCGKPA
jgi:hypothetical protein